MGTPDELENDTNNDTNDKITEWLNAAGHAHF
jgi:hypothetical protein